MILRIVDKKTGVFLRDDFSFDENTEIGLNVEPAHGLHSPKWDSEKWVEDATVAQIDILKIPYDQRIVELIRQKYTIDEEIAINRQRDTKPEEFQVYFDYCEICKNNAK